MKIWTAHEKPKAAPVLIQEGFSFAALFFGPIWLATQRAWLAAAISLLIGVLIPVLTDAPASLVLLAGEALLLGFSGRDLVRWSVIQRGYHETNVVTGRTAEDALEKLLSARPDLVTREMLAETAV